MGRGGVVWFTGLPASGKSTLARHLARLLADRGARAEVLDGDFVRSTLSKGLGFTKEDRDSNVARIGLVSGLLARNGVIAIAAAVAPYRAARDAVRAQVGDFVEVHVATPREVCEARDGSGRWAAARRGELPRFTGLDDPYEAPTAAELTIDLATEPPELGAARVLAFLEAQGYVDPVQERPVARLEEALEALGFTGVNRADASEA